jgi:hypothetical protein
VLIPEQGHGGVTRSGELLSWPSSDGGRAGTEAAGKVLSASWREADWWESAWSSGGVVGRWRKRQWPQDRTLGGGGAGP